MAGPEEHRVIEIKRAVRSIERRTEHDPSRDAGTGYTVLRLTASPIGRLLDRGVIGPAERDAATELAQAFHAITSVVGYKSPSLMLVDGRGQGSSADWSYGLILAVNRYKAWSQYWSIQKVRKGSQVAEIVIAAVIDERPMDVIARDVGLHHVTAQRRLVRGLQDYADRMSCGNKHDRRKNSFAKSADCGTESVIAHSRARRSS